MRISDRRRKPLAQKIPEVVMVSRKFPGNEGARADEG